MNIIESFKLEADCQFSQNIVLRHYSIFGIILSRSWPSTLLFFFAVRAQHSLKTKQRLLPSQVPGRGLVKGERTISVFVPTLIIEML
jgi:hypothetical protein